MDGSIPSVVRDEIEVRLATIERTEQVRLLLAVESGSRAWGFPSPDSDYDVRFVYLRTRDAYLSLKRLRDVIERPIVDEIDLGGWDIRKALGLLLKSNAAVMEWMASPIRYRPDDPVMAAIAELAEMLLDPFALGRHYAGVGGNAAVRWLHRDGPVPVKKYFYALRPALAIRWLRMQVGTPPPMRLQSLMAGCGLPTPLAAQIDALVEAKRRTNERGNAMRLPELDALIADELTHASKLPRREPPADAFDRADALFLDLVSRSGSAR